MLGSSRRFEKSLINEIEQKGPGTAWTEWKPGKVGKYTARTRNACFLNALAFCKPSMFASPNEPIAEIVRQVRRERRKQLSLRNLRLVETTLLINHTDVMRIN